MRPLLSLYGSTPAADFDSLALQAVQAEMIARGWCRNVISRHTGRVRRIFEWAVSRRFVPPDHEHLLKSVEGVRRGWPR